MSSGLPVSRRVPSLWRVARTQFNLIDQSKRFPLLFAALALGAIGPIAMGDSMYEAEFVFPFAPIMVLTIIWPVLVWRGQGPKNRTYHRILPVDHFTHDMLKVIAGAVWLWLGLALVLTGLFVSAIAAGFPQLLGFFSPAAYVSYFTTATIIYLMLSVIPILTDRPLEWMLGLSLGTAGLLILDETYRFGAARLITKYLVDSELGFSTAFYAAYANQPWHTMLGYNMPWTRLHSFWLTSTFLWLMLGIALVCVASYIANEKQPA